MKDYNVPICIIGAGGIVQDAHLPAYKIAGYTVAGITDQDYEKASAVAQKHHIQHVYKSVADMVAAHTNDVIYDIALPASELLNILNQLPNGATILMQKPLGENIDQASVLLAISREKKLLAGVNFQLRFAPYMLEAKKMIGDGLIGTITDIEIYANTDTPWALWNFLFTKPRMEIVYHSIHYVDVVRSFVGNPQKIYCRTFKHPSSAQLASVRTTMIMDYGDMLRATIHTNHNHNYGVDKQEGYCKIEGTQGAIKIGIGAIMNYPHGIPDSFEYIILKDGEAPQWQSKMITGTWFPHAFIGTMEQMQLARQGIIAQPENNIEDAFETMACVEAAYKDDITGGVSPAEFLL